MARQLLAASQQDRTTAHSATHRALFGDTRAATLWVLPRLALGWLWLEAGWRQLGDLPGPVGHLTTSTGASVAHVLPAIALTVAGIALILGLLVGPAALIGGSLSAGAWSGDSLLMAVLQAALVVLLVLSWRSAGRIGLDRWLLPLLGVSGQGSELIGRRRPRFSTLLPAMGVRPDHHNT